MKKQVTAQRIQNVVEAFSWIKWFPRSAEIVNMGLFGDRPQWIMCGVAVIAGKKVFFRYKSRSPAGDNARLFANIQVKHGIYKKLPTTNGTQRQAEMSRVRLVAAVKAMAVKI